MNFALDQADALKNLSMQNEGGAGGSKAEPTFLFLAHKAGMQNADKERVSKIVTEASRDSRFYEKQMRRKVKYEQDIEKMSAKIEKLRKDKQWAQGVQTIVQKKVSELEKKNNLNRVWVHVDMDMFYVACELRDQPELRDKPVACGSISMICTANYVARQFGVRSAMPGFIALKLCPDLIFVPLNFAKYKETSQKFKDVVEEYDPDYESGGLDEAVLDLTNYINEHGLTTKEEIEKVCYEMRMKINEVTGITCSCGVGPNKMLAKLSTEINKPNGQYYMNPVREEIQDFLSKLPIRKIQGIGSSAEQILNGLGIKTCKDILDYLPEIYVAFSEKSFDFFLRSALGISRCYHEIREDRKSVNVSRTFQTVTTVADMEKKVQEISLLLAEDLQEYKLKSKHFTLTIKTFNFDCKNRGTPIDKYTNDGTEITNVCLKLLGELMPLDPLRLIGIRATQLSADNNLNTLDGFFNKSSENKSKRNSDMKKSPTSTEQEKSSNLQTEADGEIEVTPIDQFEHDQDIEEITQNQEMFEKVRISSPITEQLPNVEKPLNDFKPQREEITCPVCNTTFGPCINKTRINNHIDKCLQNSMNQPSAPTTPTLKNFMVKGDESASSKKDAHDKFGVENKKEDGKKRKLDDGSSKIHSDLKKTKKGPQTSNIARLDSFFTKK